MSIEKNKMHKFSHTMSVTVVVDPNSDGFVYNNVAEIIREDDNTFILTRVDGSKVVLIGGKYISLEFTSEE